VILAAQNIFASTAKRDGSCPMTADIAERTEGSLLVANNDDGFTGNIHSKKTFRVGNRSFHAVHFAARLAERSDKLPCAMKNACLLKFQDCGIGVKPRSKCLSALNLLVHIQM
jgi:hypothetical protein